MYSSEKEWKILEPYFAPKKTGRPRKHNIRTIINETRYVMRTGCQWKQLPKDFPRWKTVYSFNSRLKNSGKWQEIHDALVKRVRRMIGKSETPSVGIIDSQSVKTAQKGGIEDTTLAKRSKVPYYRGYTGPCDYCIVQVFKTAKEL